jgi:integrase
MPFDARTAKLLEAGQHFTIDDCPGLRLKATVSTKSWVYRYKSPVDGKMRQSKIGDWPAMSISAAIAAWEKLRTARSAGVDPAAVKKQAAADVRAVAVEKRERAKVVKLTVRRLCQYYYEGRVVHARKAKGAAEVLRMFDTMLGDFGDLPAQDVTRSAAFDLLEQYIHIPVQCGRIRCELGAAWDYGLDSGRLPESAPNWWRLIMRGKLRSKGKVIKGVHAGPGKRFLVAKELGALVRWLPNFTARIEDALTLYMWTCCRGSEIVAMERAEITEEENGLWWTIPKHKTKNARHELATDLRVPLFGRAAVVVRRRLQSEPGSFLFPNSRALGHIEQKTIGCAVWMRRRDCVTRSDYPRSRYPDEIPLWAPHDLRRSSRTLLASMGCPDEVGEAILGHMKEGIVGVYNLHRYDTERWEWLKKLSDQYETLSKD